MKILLTGQPKIGKSTIINSFKKAYAGQMVGFVTHSINGKHNSRDGFEVENIEGDKKVLAHKTLIASDVVIGNQKFVDMNVVDSFVVPELKKGLQDKQSLILIDEIGRMQIVSPKFLQTVTSILSEDTNVLGTIVYDPEPWSIAFKEHQDVVLVTVSEANRDVLPELLLLIFNNIFYSKLSKKQMAKLYALLREYFSNNNVTQIKKLFNNALPYILHKKVADNGNNSFTVVGNTNTHLVRVHADMYSCDCPLFNGQGDFTGQQGVCSHIQAVILFTL